MVVVVVVVVVVARHQARATSLLPTRELVRP